MVIEYAKNGSLMNSLNDRNFDMDRNSRKRITMEILQGILYIYNSNIIHKDLKICDFELAKDKVNSSASSKWWVLLGGWYQNWWIIQNILSNLTFTL